MFIGKLFETIKGSNYQVLLNFGICCKELEGLKLTSSCVCVDTKSELPGENLISPFPITKSPGKSREGGHLT